MRLPSGATRRGDSRPATSAVGPKKVCVYLGVILAVGFAARLIFGLAAYDGLVGAGGSDRNWWDSGYTAFGQIAASLVEGHGFRLGPLRAARPPLYPLLLAGLYRVGGRSSVLPVLIQAVIGTATVFVAYRIARVAFEQRTGLAAAAIVAVYPYYVAHDTAQQETALFTLLTATTVCFLVIASRGGAPIHLTVAGGCAGLALLCREALLPFLPLAAWWLVRGSGSSSHRLRRAAVFLATAGLVVSPWLARNAVVHGMPVFSSRLGLRVWIGNNPVTLSHYPWESIDLSTRAALAVFSDSEQAEVVGLGERDLDRWFLRRALAFAVNEPLRTAWYAVVKVVAAFGPFKSPLDGSWHRSLLYTASYVPVALLAVYGVVTGVARGPVVSLLGLLIVAFLAVVLPTHAHTSHRSYLDVYLAILAAWTALARGGFAAQRGADNLLITRN